MNRKKMTKESSATWALPDSPKREAESLVLLIGQNGDTQQTIRDLIDVSEEDTIDLRRWAENEPEIQARIARSLDFRRKVLEEFEILVRDGNFVTRHARPPRRLRSAHVACSTPKRGRQHG
jgi:hypothetical protein